MKIYHGKLADGTYIHNNEAEMGIREMLERIGFSTFTTNEPGVKNALQDYGVERFCVEQKITKHSDGFNLELYHDEKCTRPSAFSLCRAQLTLIIQHGKSTKHGPVWKVRMFRTRDLLAAANPDFKDGDLRSRLPVIESWGAYSIHIKAWVIPHVWFGDIVRHDDNIIDTDSFIPNPDVRKEFDHWFSEDMMLLPSEEYYNKYGTY